MIIYILEIMIYMIIYIIYSMEEDGVIYDNSITDKKVKNRIEELKKSGEIKEYIIVRIGD